MMLAVAGNSIYQNIQLIEIASKADGMVIEIVKVRSSRMNSSSFGGPVYAPKISFDTDSGVTQSFLSRDRTSFVRYEKGDKVAVLYDPKLPSFAKINHWNALWEAPGISLLIGLVFTMVGFGTKVHSIFRKRREKTLRRIGMPIQAELNRVEPSDFRINRRRLYRITARWTDSKTSTEHTFYSKYLWDDPTHQLKKEKITIFISKNNPKKYYMDISFLPMTK